MTTREKLEALAANMWWSWHPEALDLFRRLNPEQFDTSRGNPRVALKTADGDLFADPAFAGEVDAVYSEFSEYMQHPGSRVEGPRVSYFCMEYGLHESLPTYAGGLGILAGDHAKAASDLGLRFSAIGLFLREGYFEQHVDPSGWQVETYNKLDTSVHPFTLETYPDGRPVIVTVHLGRQPLELQAWRIDLGHTRLYLLDSNLPSNPAEYRGLTEKLYQGDRLTRIQQEIVLGIGGVRLVRALGIETDVYHMNEGHCAFLTLELLREKRAEGMNLADAEAWVREHSVFTTHTPVMAGHDRFAGDLFVEQMAEFKHQASLNDFEILSYGRVNPHDYNEMFTMTVLGLKLSRQANGVSALNGEVARGQWNHLYPDRSVDQVPVGHVTNGIHVPTWATPYAHSFLRQHFGNWVRTNTDPDLWHRLGSLSDEEIWAYRRSLRNHLIEAINEQRVIHTVPSQVRLNPDALTIGFARRFATYKRAPLLFFDVERAARIFSRIDCPIQILYAGKAHPADEGGKSFIQQIVGLTQHEAFRGKLVFIEDYNMEVGRLLVSGCDVWLNNPRRPMEASGTSGQKIAVHGGLNVSILDGWWPEGFNGQNGWSIGYDASANFKDPHEQDYEDANFLYEVLEQKVIPAFYDRDASGLPRTWISYVKNAMDTLTYEFSAARMVNDYIDQMYTVPAHQTVEN